MLGLW